MKFKLPEESTKNNKFFHPKISNSEYIRLLKLDTLPSLKSTKAYKEKIMFYQKKADVNEKELEEYTDKMGDFTERRVDVDTVSSTPSQPPTHESTLTVEVIKGWASKKTNMSDVHVEIEKVCEYDPKPQVFYTDSRNAQISDT